MSEVPQGANVSNKSPSPEASEAQRHRPHKSIVHWVTTQVWQFVGLVLHMAFLGVARAVWQRRFHWRAFAAGIGTMLAGIALSGRLAFHGPDWGDDARQALLGFGSMAAMTLGGWLIARVRRGVGIWEIYLAALLTTGVVLLELSVGWGLLFGLEPWVDEQSAIQIMSVGVQMLGPLWDRTLVLAAVIGSLLALFGGSLAFVFHGDEGRFDGSFAVEWYVSLRHLRGRESGLASVTALVAVGGISLGVAALVAVTAVMSGYQEDIQTKILGTNAHLVVQKYGLDFSEHQDVAKKALEVEGVLAAAPFAFNEAMLTSGTHGQAVLLKGISPSQAAQVTGIGNHLCNPRKLGPPTGDVATTCKKVSPRRATALLEKMLKPRDGLPSLVVGEGMYRKLGRPIGASVFLTTPVGTGGRRNNAPRRMAFRLAGVFRSGMHEFDTRLVYLDIAACQDLLGMGESVSGLEFRVADPEAVEVTAEQLLRAIGPHPYRTMDWRELNSGIFTALRLQKIVMFLVLTSIVIVAAFNIASTLFMAVIEKAHEVAVLKSMGARDQSIMKIFVLQGWITGVLGAVGGLILGLLVAWFLGQLEISIAADVYMVESLQVVVRWHEVLLTVAATLLISHLATLYPALKAAHQIPVDALRDA